MDAMPLLQEVLSLEATIKQAFTAVPPQQQPGATPPPAGPPPAGPPQVDSGAPQTAPAAPQPIDPDTAALLMSLQKRLEGLEQQIALLSERKQARDQQIAGTGLL